MVDRDYVEKRLARLGEIEGELSEPATAANQKKFRALVQEHAALKRVSEKAALYFGLAADIAGHREVLANPGEDPGLKELAREELAAMEPRLGGAEQDLLIALLPPNPTETRSAVFEIRAGTGGEEAALFAADLFRMYSKYVARRGWKLSLVDASPSAIGGYKEIVFLVEGEGSYGALQYESGGHRVQRVPVTEGSGRIHTSAATVAVFPEAEEEDEIEIKPDEIRVDIFCSSGPGGQSVNTTYSAIRITHLATGVVAQSQDERSQHRNKERAMQVLKSRLLDLRRREEEERMGNARRSLAGSGDRSERIRTYNFPQNRMTDHRINLTIYSLERIIEGEIDEVLNALREHDIRLRLEAEMTEKNPA